MEAQQMDVKSSAASPEEQQPKTSPRWMLVAIVASLGALGLVAYSSKSYGPSSLTGLNKSRIQLAKSKQVMYSTLNDDEKKDLFDGMTNKSLS